MNLILEYFLIRDGIYYNIGMIIKWCISMEFEEYYTCFMLKAFHFDSVLFKWMS